MTKLVMTSLLAMTNDQFSGHEINRAGHEINWIGHDSNWTGHEINWTGHDGYYWSWPVIWSWMVSRKAIFKTLKIAQINLMNSFMTTNWSFVMTSPINIMTRKLVICHEESTGRDQLGHRLDESQNLILKIIFNHF